jgi:tryptophan 2,3-dioxygenase
MYYGTYLELDKILNAQNPVSSKEDAHDETLFIIIHQAYELWFKQILFEVDSVTGILSQPSLNDNSPQMQTIVHRLHRVVTILKVLVHQIDIMETMTPMEFLDFRDRLRPASGFQSIQFKILESKLGLKYENRHGQEYYLSQLTPEDADFIKNVEKERSLLDLINNWLERMPFFDDELFWQNFEGNDFWKAYQSIYTGSLAEAEKNNVALFNGIFNSPGSRGSLSPRASRAALFIFLYRGYPMLELPFQLLDSLLQLDNELGNWRYRHINMVQRMIGTRIGTGGSSGAGYLKSAMDKHSIFKEIAQLNSFLVDRRKLPPLSDELAAKLGYQV